MGEAEASVLAGIFRRAFPVDPPAWGARAFLEFSKSGTSVIHRHDHGAIFGRLAGDEAEICLIFVDPSFQRRGIAQSLLERFLRDCKSRGGNAVFLEVSADNAPAKAFYQKNGFMACGKRPGYYAREGRAAGEALILRRELGE